MQYSNVKGILFDLGYTLIEFKECDWQSVNHIGKLAGYKSISSANNNLPQFEIFNDQFEEIKEKYRKRYFDDMLGWNITDAVTELLNKYSVTNSKEQSKIFIEKLYDTGRDQMVIRDDTISALTKLKKLGYKLGIVSNTNYPGYLHRDDLVFHGLNTYFEFSLFSSEFGFRKPHPEIFREGACRLKTEPAQTIYVGDRFKIDSIGARKAGMIPIIKRCSKRDYPKSQLGDIPIIDSISELPNLVLSS